MQWKVRAIRGATTARENSVAEIREVVNELLDTLEAYNQLDATEIISVIFSVTRDLDAIFPAQVARAHRPKWDNIPLLDVQQMYVEGSLERCIRVLLQFNTPDPNIKIYHPYLRGAKNLRPDWNLSQATFSRSQSFLEPLPHGYSLTSSHR
jgi:chorismate mutase